MKSTISILAAALVVGLTSCSSDYSTGERIGTLNKLSRKGFFYKTWEGEIVCSGLKRVTDSKGGESSAANTFDFSLDAEHHRGENIEALKDSLDLALDAGLPVKLHYNQEQCNDWNSNRGETDYYVDKVTILR